MTFADDMIAHDEAQAAIERERLRWAAEKAVSRPASVDDMRWILRQANNDQAVAEKFLAVWDGLRLNPALARHVVWAMSCAMPALPPLALPKFTLPMRLRRPRTDLVIRLALYIALEWAP